MKRSGAKDAGSASTLISQRIAELGDWRGDTLAHVRALIHQADPDIVEEWKWMGTPVFSHDGIVCTGETYKNVVKLTFAKGAFLRDPARLFNSSLEGNQRRAIDLREGEKLPVRAFTTLIAEAVALNGGSKGEKASSARSKKASPARSKKASPARSKKASPARSKKASSAPTNSAGQRKAAGAAKSAAPKLAAKPPLAKRAPKLKAERVR